MGIVMILIQGVSGKSIPSHSEAEISLVSNLWSPWIPGRTKCPRKYYPSPQMKAIIKEGKTHPGAEATIHKSSDHLVRPDLEEHTETRIAQLCTRLALNFNRLKPEAQINAPNMDLGHWSLSSVPLLNVVTLNKSLK